jgi:hypothetical protein
MVCGVFVYSGRGSPIDRGFTGLSLQEGIPIYIVSQIA